MLSLSIFNVFSRNKDRKYVCIHIQDIITYRWIIADSLITSFIVWIVKTVKRIFSALEYIKNSQNSKRYSWISLNHKKNWIFIVLLVRKWIKFFPDTTYSILGLYKSLKLVIEKNYNNIDFEVLDYVMEENNV